MPSKLLVVLIILLAANLVFFAFYLKPSQPITGEVVNERTTQEIESSFPTKAYISKIIDGDTVIIAGESVRLLGMDTDERGKPCFKEAKDRIEELILNEEVMLETDAEDKDQYDRYLRYIFLNGKNINLQMVEEGLAVARFVKGTKYKTEIIEAEQKARKKKIGCKWREVVLEEEVVVEEKQEEVIKNVSSDNQQNSGRDEEKIKSVEDLGYECGSNIYNCGDFRSHAEAQAVYESCGGVGNDIHRLDRDKDGVACETLS